MKVQPVGLLPIVAVILLSVGLANHVLVVPMLLDVAQRDAWMSVIVSLIIIMPWAAIPLHGFMVKVGRERLDVWMSKRFPKFVVWLVIGYGLLIFFSIGTETLIITSSWTSTTYLPRTPTIVVILVFAGLCVYAASLGLRAIAYISCLLLPAVVLLGDFVMSTNLPHKDYRYLMPFLEHGWSPVLHASLSSITAFAELFVLLFIQHHMKRPFKRWHLIALVLFLALLTAGPLTGALSQFGPAEADKMRFPAFSQWRLVTIGRYLEHVDFLAIFQWLSGALARLSLSLHIIVDYSPIRRMKRRWIPMTCLGLVMSGIAFFWTEHMVDYDMLIRWFFKYLGIVTLSLIVMLYFISLFRRRAGGDEGKGEKRT